VQAALAIERTCQAGEAAVLVSHAATVVGVTAALLRRPAAEVRPSLEAGWIGTCASKRDIIGGARSR
jgi:hypothetical protein